MKGGTRNSPALEEHLGLDEDVSCSKEKNYSVSLALTFGLCIVATGDILSGHLWSCSSHNSYFIHVCIALFQYLHESYLSLGFVLPSISFIKSFNTELNTNSVSHWTWNTTVNKNQRKCLLLWSLSSKVPSPSIFASQAAFSG